MTRPKPETKAGRRILRWIDAGVTDDRMLYAVIKNGPTVADLRAAILEIEREARHAGFLECGKSVA